MHVNLPRAIARIAKALMIPPKFLLLDSPSSLDCSSGTKGGGENGGAGFYTSYPKIPEIAEMGEVTGRPSVVHPREQPNSRLASRLVFSVGREGGTHFR